MVKKIITKALGSFWFGAVKSCQKKFKEPIMKNTETLVKRTPNWIDTHITENDNPIGKTTPQVDDPSELHLSLTNNWYSYEKRNHSEHWTLQ